MGESAFVAGRAPLVRRALKANEDNSLREVGKRGRFIYLTEDDINDTSVWIFDEMISTAISRDQQPFADGYTKVRNAIAPFVGKQLVRTGIWWDGMRYEIYVDPVGETVVHIDASKMDDPGERFWQYDNLESRDNQQ